MIEVFQIIAENKKNWVNGNDLLLKIGDNKAECMIKDSIPFSFIIDILREILKV